MYGPCPRGLNFYIVLYREIVKKIFFSRTVGPNGTIFSKEIQVCSNEVPGVTNGHALRRHCI